MRLWPVGRRVGPTELGPTYENGQQWWARSTGLGLLMEGSSNGGPDSRGSNPEAWAHRPKKKFQGTPQKLDLCRVSQQGHTTNPVPYAVPSVWHTTTLG